jgi:curved DNA-binding protein
MAKRDYYEVLGVRRDATADHIRSAYRKAARKYHPDVNKAADASDRFKEATAAYEVLSDPQKRKMYDQHGFNAPQGPFAGGASGSAWRDVGGGVSVSFEDIFGMGGGAGGGGAFSGMSLQDILGSLGGMRGRGRRGGQRAAGRSPWGAAAQQPPADIEHELSLDFLDAIRGTTADLRIQRPGGGGETLQVKIPPGVRDGQKIRLRGRGNAGGDLYIVVRVREHPYFRREGDDIYVDLPISVGEAVLGASVEAPTLEGPRQVKIPPCSGSSRTLRLRGLGAPSGGERGDQYVVLKVMAPPAVSEEGARLMRQFEQIEKYNPRKDAPWTR